MDNFPPISSLCFSLFLSFSLSLSKDNIVLYTRRHFFPFYTRGQFLPFCPFWLLIYFSPTLISPITFVPTSISCCLTPFSLYLDKFSPHLCLAFYQRTNTPLYIYKGQLLAAYLVMRPAGCLSVRPSVCQCFLLSFVSCAVLFISSAQCLRTFIPLPGHFFPY